MLGHSLEGTVALRILTLFLLLHEVHHLQHFCDSEWSFLALDGFAFGILVESKQILILVKDSFLLDRLEEPRYLVDFPSVEVLRVVGLLLRFHLIGIGLVLIITNSAIILDHLLDLVS